MGVDIAPTDTKDSQIADLILENSAHLTVFGDEITDVNPIFRLDNWSDIDPIEERIMNF